MANFNKDAVRIDTIESRIYANMRPSNDISMESELELMAFQQGYHYGNQTSHKQSKQGVNLISLIASFLGLWNR